MLQKHGYITNPLYWDDDQSTKARFVNPQGTYGWDESTNEWRYRVEDPKLFRKNTFRYKKLTEWYADRKQLSGVGLIVAKYKKQHVPPVSTSDSMNIQALRFDKSYFTKREAQDWVDRYFHEIFRARESREQAEHEKRVSGKGKTKKSRKSARKKPSAKNKQRAANPTRNQKQELIPFKSFLK